MAKKLNERKHKFSTKLLSALLSAAMFGSAFAATGSAVISTASVPVSAVPISAEYDYDFAQTVQDGVILHAWDWSFENIRDNMQSIAEAGYTAIQTSPIQLAKESTVGLSNDMWWLYYQPADFVIDNTGNSALGDLDDFMQMCEEAHKYGIHVIVDVVANHLGNDGDPQTKSSAIPAQIRDDYSCWHEHWNEANDSSSREKITDYSMAGDASLPDLNTESPIIQERVINYLRACIDAGADGFRFDAAKHIATSADGEQYTFWDNVIPAAKLYYKDYGYFDSLYCYGEVLGDSGAQNNSDVIGSYLSNINLTCEYVGNDIRNALNESRSTLTNYVDYYKGDRKVPANKLVLWAESHDTYQGDGRESTNIDQAVINRTWALVAGRANATALYYARTPGYRSGKIGEITDLAWSETPVAEVNKFHNAMDGEGEYLSVEDNISCIERGAKGAVIVDASGGDSDVHIPVHTLEDGEYLDHISGNYFIVSNGRINGHIGDTGIAVIYNEETGPYIKAVSSEKNFAETLSVALKTKGMVNASYVTSEGDEGEFVGRTVITIGERSPDDTVITVTVTAVDEDDNKYTEQFNYYKYNPAYNAGRVPVFFDNSAYQWIGGIKAYLYSGGNEKSGWPGEAMTELDNNLYVINVEPTYADGYVIFYNSDNTRYPGNGEPGLEIGNKPMILKANYAFEEYVPDHDVLVNTSFVSDDNIEVNETVDVHFDCDGGYGENSYAVEILRGGIQEYSSDFDPDRNIQELDVFDEAGTYTIFVTVKDCHDQVARKSFEVTVTGSDQEQFVNTSYSNFPNGECYVGDKIVITLSSTGRDESLVSFNYQILINDDNLLEEGTGIHDSIEFTPNDAGELRILIDAVYNVEDETAEKLIVINVKKHVDNSSFISDGPYIVNKPITVYMYSEDSGFLMCDVEFSYDGVHYYNWSSVSVDESYVEYTPEQTGVLYLRVRIRDEESGDSQERDFVVTVYDELVNTSYIENPAEHYNVGDRIIINLGASGGLGNYKFTVTGLYTSTDDFFEYVSDVYGGIVEVPVERSGLLTIRVMVDDESGGTCEASYTVDVLENLENLCEIRDHDKKGIVNEDVIIDCAARGGTGEYTYFLAYKTNKDDQYRTVIDNDSGEEGMIFTPDSYGNYWFRISVEDISNGRTATIYRYMRVLPQPLENECALATFYTYTAPITIRCGASGGYDADGYTYALYCKDTADETNTYYEVFGFDAYTTMDFLPDRSGVFMLKISVKDGKNCIRSIYKKVRMGLTNTSTLSSDKIYLGETMTVNCSAEGGYPGYTFSLSVKESSQTTYTQLYDYDARETMEFTPEAEGKYTLKISVRDSKEKTVKNVYKTFRVAPARLENLCTLESDRIYLDPDQGFAELTVFCDAEGGHGENEYAVYVKDNGVYVEKAGYSTADTIDITFDKTGTYTLKLSVKDRKGVIKNVYKTVKVVKSAN